MATRGEGSSEEIHVELEVGSDGCCNRGEPVLPFGLWFVTPWTGFTALLEAGAVFHRLNTEAEEGSDAVAVVWGGGGGKAFQAIQDLLVVEDVVVPVVSFAGCSGGHGDRVDVTAGLKRKGVPREDRLERSSQLEGDPHGKVIGIVSIFWEQFGVEHTDLVES